MYNDTCIYIYIYIYMHNILKGAHHGLHHLRIRQRPAQPDCAAPSDFLLDMLYDLILCYII